MATRKMSAMATIRPGPAQFHLHGPAHKRGAAFPKSPSGSQVDTVTLTEVPSQLNFQPEEPLSQLNGQDAFGEWRLEIWDDRVGATNNNPQLDDWQLTFHLPPDNPPPVVSLSHCVPYVNTLPPNGIQYFVVDVPQWATMATNILGFAEERFTTNPLPVTVLFNQTNFPVLTNLALIGRRTAARV